jgi:hypothetical protein
LLVILLLPACATIPPTSLELDDALSNPEAYKGKRLELTGFVIEYEPARGDVYRTLQFTLGYGPEEKLRVYAAGYTADAITKASILVRNAYESGKPLTVTGKLELGAPDSHPELKLETIEYLGEKINVSRGPRTSSGFELGGWQFVPSIGIEATITP